MLLRKRVLATDEELSEGSFNEAHFEHLVDWCVHVVYRLWNALVPGDSPDQRSCARSKRSGAAGRGNRRNANRYRCEPDDYYQRDRILCAAQSAGSSVQIRGI